MLNDNYKKGGEPLLRHVSSWLWRSSCACFVGFCKRRGLNGGTHIGGSELESWNVEWSTIIMAETKPSLHSFDSHTVGYSSHIFFLCFHDISFYLNAGAQRGFCCHPTVLFRAQPLICMFTVSSCTTCKTSTHRTYKSNTMRQLSVFLLWPLPLAFGSRRHD